MIFQAITTMIFSVTFLAFCAEDARGRDSISHILKLIRSQNNSVLAARQALTASALAKKGSGYFPDPFFKVNIFGSPIETRNGPQKSSIILNQPIPWPSALKAESDLASSREDSKREQLEILLLELEFMAKSLIFKHVELNEKHKTKSNMADTLNDLSKVVLGRLTLGTANQSEVSRINIELATLSQDIREIKAGIAEVAGSLKALSGGKDVSDLLPERLEARWSSIDRKPLSLVNPASHPVIRLARAKIKSAQAATDQAKANRLPKIAASVSWFRTDKPEPMMASPDPGKDAWAVGASVSLPLWQGKYESLEKSTVAKLSEARFELAQKKTDLKESIHSIYERYLSADDITTMYRKDILPQAIQALKSERDSYSLGKSTFEKVIENYLRVVRTEDQLTESRIKQATLKAALEKISGQTL